jgi:hypothetical protein
VVILFCIAAGVLPTGCKEKQQAGQEKKFEIDKEYARGPLTVHIRLDKGKLSIADILTVEFEAAVESGYDVKMPQMGAEVNDFGIVDWFNLGDKLGEGNKLVKRYRYKLEPFLSGKEKIPEYTFEFYDVNKPEEKKYKLVTEPIEIEVTSLLGEKRGQLQIADIEGVVEMPKNKSYLWVWAGAAGAILAGTALALFIVRKNKKTAERILRPAHEIAYGRLKRLIDEDLIKAGRIKEFYERISNILRHYIEDRFDLHAPERTTEEFLFEIKDSGSLGSGDKESVGRFLMHCDLVKFAEYNPTVEQIQETFNVVREFIEKTKTEEKKIDSAESPTGETADVGSER